MNEIMRIRFQITMRTSRVCKPRLWTAELGYAVIPRVYVIVHGIQRYRAIKKVWRKRGVIRNSGCSGNPDVGRISAIIGPIASCWQKRIYTTVRQRRQRERGRNVVFRVRSEIVPVRQRPGLRTAQFNYFAADLRFKCEKISSMPR